MNLHKVSTLKFEGQSSEFPRGYGVAMLYGIILRTMLTDGRNVLDFAERERLLAGGRWVGLHDKEATTTFDNETTRPPNNGREIVSLFRRCLELDPLFLACFDPLAVHFILKHDPLVGSFRCLVPLALPPAWLFDGHKPWARLMAAGSELGERLGECCSEAAENAMQLRVLTAMLNKYEPKEEQPSQE